MTNPSTDANPAKCTVPEPHLASNGCNHIWRVYHSDRLATLMKRYRKCRLCGATDTQLVPLEFCVKRQRTITSDGKDIGDAATVDA